MNEKINGDYYIKNRVRLEIRRMVQLIRLGFQMAFCSTKDTDVAVLDMKNSHKGESCIIVGNGPSLTLQDLDAIHASGMDAFASNRIVDLLKDTEWRPDYLCVMDPGFLLHENGRENSLKYYESAKAYGVSQFFFSDVLKKFIPEKYWKEIHFCNVIYSPLFSKVLLPFSKKLEYWYSDLGSVTHFAIQVACYMGYSTIYLCGLDNTYTKYLDNNGQFVINNSVESHAAGMRVDSSDLHIERIPKNKTEAYKIGGFADKRKNDLGYVACKEFAQKNGVEIINLTRGGFLEVFPRKSFEEHFGVNK